jgi:hypothetical protein
VKKLFEITTEERMLKHFVKEFEILMKLRYPACSKAKGADIRQGLTIFDFTHGSITSIGK